MAGERGGHNNDPIRRKSKANGGGRGRGRGQHTGSSQQLRASRSLDTDAYAPILDGPVKTYYCGECEEPAEDNTIACDCCHMWYHQSCSSLSPTEFQVLTNGSENITYTCPSCLTSKGKDDKRMRDMEQKICIGN